MATRRSYDDPPEGYQLSRLALRERYGQRKIDGSAKLSPKDATPSARIEEIIKRKNLDPVEGRGAAQLIARDEFRKQFLPRGETASSPGFREQFQPRMGAGPGTKPGFADQFQPKMGAPAAGTAAEAEARFYDSFKTNPVGSAPMAAPSGRPSGWSNAAAAPPMPAGATSTPYGQVSVSYAKPNQGRSLYIGDETGDRTSEFWKAPATPLAYSLSDPSPVGASALASYLPATSRPGGFAPPWRKQPQPSYMSTVLNGASKWVASYA